MLYAGLDPSLSGTGMILVNDKGRVLKYRHLKIKSVPGFKHLRKLQRKVRRTILKWKPDYVFIESPYANPKNAKGMVRTFYYHALIRDMLIDLYIPWLEFPPKTIKKHLTGNGNAGKPLMVEIARKKSKYDIPNHDVADAYGAVCLGVFTLKK